MEQGPDPGRRGARGIPHTFKLLDSQANHEEGGPAPQEPSTRQSSSGEQQDKTARERSLIRQLEANLQHREEALRQKQARAREGPKSDASGGWDVRETSMDPYQRTDNRQPIVD